MMLAFGAACTALEHATASADVAPRLYLEQRAAAAGHGSIAQLLRRLSEALPGESEEGEEGEGPNATKHHHHRSGAHGGGGGRHVHHGLPGAARHGGAPRHGLEREPRDGRRRLAEGDDILTHTPTSPAAGAAGSAGLSCGGVQLDMAPGGAQGPVGAQAQDCEELLSKDARRSRLPAPSHGTRHAFGPAAQPRSPLSTKWCVARKPRAPSPFPIHRRI